MSDRLEHEYVNELLQDRDTLLAAARALYDAGRWTCDRPCDEARLWEALRDAIGLPPGYATSRGIGHE
jgi:hypothetical protein